MYRVALCDYRSLDMLILRGQNGLPYYFDGDRSRAITSAIGGWTGWSGSTPIIDHDVGVLGELYYWESGCVLIDECPNKMSLKCRTHKMKRAIEKMHVRRSF